MDNFEALVRLLLERDNYWTRQSEKIEITKGDKRSIQKPSMPRPEIDVVAFKPKENIIIAMEVKSFLDSPGVKARDICIPDQTTPSGRYKLFTCSKYRTIVLQHLLESYKKTGLATSNTEIKLGLAAGKIYSKDQAQLAAHFHENDWMLWTPEYLAQKTRALAELGYENDPFILLSKLLSKNPPETKR